MANVMDYLAWRGDLPLAASPWNELDSLLMTCLVYNDLGEQAMGEKGVPLRDLSPLITLSETSRWREVPGVMADTVRFGDILLHDFVDIVDAEREIQFSAVMADLPDGTAYVAFRGTDNTLVGWRENFNMAYESPVPAQMEAVTYLERAGLRCSCPLRVGGHSKGGNLASYAAAHVSEDVQVRLLGVHSFDGPGLDDATMNSAAYARIKPVLRSFIPQSSVVGLLMNHHQDYTVVQSTAVSLLQHDPFTWQVLCTAFVELPQVDQGSLLMDETVHEWLKASTTDQRRSFVDTLFSILDATNAVTFAEMGEDKLKNTAAILMAAYDLEPETRRMFLQLIGRFLHIGAANAWDMLTENPRALLQDTMTKEENV